MTASFSTLTNSNCGSSTSLFTKMADVLSSLGFQAYQTSVVWYPSDMGKKLTWWTIEQEFQSGKLDHEIWSSLNVFPNQHQAFISCNTVTFTRVQTYKTRSIKFFVLSTLMYITQRILNPTLFFQNFLRSNKCGHGESSSSLQINDI